ILHGGSKEHHIHHLHAHQWLHTPDSDNSAYLDSQALGPGTGFTTEIVHNGSGNRNQTAGDSIFHCHFYPHFAMGMWALWRVHDVLETGTHLDGDGRPAAGSRALPDGEIAAGTPIPGLVPLPTLAMAPMPQAQVSIVNGNAVINGTGNPGFPFFIPGQAGHRPPHPPLDTIDDGGLPRHIITDGTTVHFETRLDFDKVLLTANAQAIPETGAPVELAAMNFHAQRVHPSFKPDGTPANFITNGLPPQPGAPFADPCVDDNGNPAGRPRSYKAAVFQFDIKLNKAGWHFPQQRMLALWDDVAPTIAGTRPPEPFFFRANTNDCITFYHTNLVPNIYALDDYQVRTPTDIIGQHIHLVKFDVTSSDGAGNGWNYEDGTFSPDEVLERIHAINETGGLVPFGGGAKTILAAQPHPFFGTVGAQTTVQRWFADNVLNNLGEDRTLRTVFTHDHFGPSTHQQVGLYAGLVIEPEGSQWRHSQTGEIFGTRFDGGPTSFMADILTANPADSYREFMLEFADFQHAYKAGGGVDAQGNPIPDPANVINPPVKDEIGLPFLLKPAPECPGGFPLPCPEAISAAEPGTQVVNYRDEPVALRVRDPQTNMQAAGDAGDLSKVFLSNITRADADFNVQPNFYPPLTGGVQPGDPFTPLLRAYEEDRVQIRMLVGAHEEGHNFNFNGIKWLFEPSEPNSGFKSSQMAGISEHFEFIVPGLSAVKGGVSFADYLYQPSASSDGQWTGVWGILRAYNGGAGLQPDLLTLPSNPDGKAASPANNRDFNGVCPRSAPDRKINVTAVTAQQALTGGTLIYNSRTMNGGPLNDPTAILYVRSEDLKNGKLKAGVPIEPLVIRANAGDCIELTLNNALPAMLPDLAGFNTMPMIVNFFNANQVAPSNNVGLHAQLLAYDQTSSDGANVGFNPIQTAPPGGVVKYKWYAGDLRMNSNDQLVATPVEFGAVALISSDPIKHSNKGAIGSLIIEPQGSTWVEDASSRAQATVTVPGQGSFREFVLQFQTDINLRFGDGSAIPLTANQEDAEDSGQKGFNYRTEPIWFRMGHAPDSTLQFTRTVDFTNALSNTQVGGDPQTPIFTAKAGTPVRFRVLQSGGHQRNNVFLLHGHVWQEEPWINGSTRIGSNPLSEFYGNQWGFGASANFNIVPQNGAGGKFRITGDFLYKTLSGFQFDGGLWGIFRVTP
ncbi:MAG TPA: copper oxidase, partial [Blastocatellia bacterium]|nr:copper oxidase [Blastocatellia bacterium]